MFSKNVYVKKNILFYVSIVIFCVLEFLIFGILIVREMFVRDNKLFIFNY